MSYTKTNWEDFPSTATAVTAARLNNIENGVYTLDSAMSNVKDVLSDLYEAILYAFVGMFPEYYKYRIMISPTTTPTIMGTGGYFDIDTTQYGFYDHGFDYTFDGMLLYRNDALIKKVGYNFFPIVNGEVEIGGETYTSSVTTGVRVQFVNVTFDNTDILYVYLFIKPENGATAAGVTVGVLSGTDSNSNSGIATNLDT